MAEIPDFKALGQRPAPRASQKLTDIKVTSGHEGDVARAKAKIGQSIAGIGEAIAEVQLRGDNIAVEDAWNQLQMKTQDLEGNAETGFKLVRGADVADETFHDTQIDRFNSASSELSTGLKNDRQRALFSRRSDITKRGYNASLINHRASEMDRYASGVEETTLKVGTSQIMSNAFDGVAVEAALVRSKAALEAKGKRLGHSPEQTKQNVKDYYEVNVASLVAVAADSNIDTANAYLKRYDEYLGEDTKLKLKNQIEKASILGEVQAKTDEIRAVHDDYKDQINAAKKLKGEERKQVVASITAANDLDIKVKKQGQAIAGEEGISMLNAGRPVPSSLYGKMDAKTALAVRQREISGVAPTRDNGVVLNELNNFSMNDMMEVDLNQYSYALTDPTLKKFKSEQQQLKDGNKTGSTKRQRITASVKTLFNGKAEPENFAHVQSIVNDWEASQTPPPKWNQTQEFIDGLQDQVLTGGEFFGGFFGRDKEMKGKIKVEGVPDKHILKIINKLEKDDQEASDENIKKLYDMGVSFGLF